MACTLEHALAARGCLTVLLDGDNVRHGLNANLGFTGERGGHPVGEIESGKKGAESGGKELEGGH